MVKQKLLDQVRHVIRVKHLSYSPKIGHLIFDVAHTPEGTTSETFGEG